MYRAGELSQLYILLGSGSVGHTMCMHVHTCTNEHNATFVLPFGSLIFEGQMPLTCHAMLLSLFSTSKHTQWAAVFIRVNSELSSVQSFAFRSLQCNTLACDGSAVE